MKKIIIILILFCSIQGFGQERAHYFLNGNSNDATGNVYNGTDYNITYTQSMLYDGALFNGTSSKIQCSATVGNLNLDYTISCLINVNSLPSTGAYMNIISNYDVPSLNANRGIDIRLFNDAGVQKIEYVHSAQVSQYKVASVAYTLTTNKWYHLVCVFNRSTIRIFIDGVQVASTVATVPLPTITKLFNIGNFGYYTPTLSELGRWFNGRIDEIIAEPSIWSISYIKNKTIYYKGLFSN